MPRQSLSKPLAALVAGVAVLAFSGVRASAAPVDPVARLQARVDELERALADLPSALDALRDLDNQLRALERDVDRSRAARSGDADVRRALDELRAQLDEVDRRLSRTEARAAELTAPPVALGYDEGLFLHSAVVDVTLEAAVQPRYSAVIRPAPSANGSSFELHHAQLALGARVVTFLGVRALFDFGAEYTDAGGLAMARELYAEARPLGWLTVRGGKLRVPFSRQRLTNELRFTFLDRALATRALTFGEDLGALVEARFFGERLIVQAAITDGTTSPAKARNDHLDLAYTARVIAQPLGPLAPVEGDRARSPRPRFAVGAAVRYDLTPTDLPPPLNDLDHDGRVDNVEVVAFGAELAARWAGFAVEGEYFLRRERPGFGRATRVVQGGYGQASAMVWRGLELAARFSYSELPLLRPPVVGVLGDAPQSGLEAAGAINWYLWGERVKGQLGYAYRRDTAADPFDQRRHEGHVLEVQAQAGF